MSHFTVAVFSHSPDEVDTLLAPFDEQSEEYYEIVPASRSIEEYRAEYESANKNDYPTFEDYIENYHGYIIEDGVVGYRSNPNAKWDWYQTGGRWMGSLRLKEGCTGNDGDISWATHPSRIGVEGRCDQALLKDVDLSPDPEEYAKAVRFWEVVVEGDAVREDEDKSDFYTFWKPEYYIQQFGTKENYAIDRSKFGTWAIITPDGEWYEKGDMGWFSYAVSTAESREAYDNVFDAAVAKYLEDPDIWITIVDCHI